MKKVLIIGLLVSTFFSGMLSAAEYKIDKEGAHAFIQFKIKHLGYSWLLGRFNDFDGQFSYDKENESDSKISVIIDVASLDSNHAERDKHLKGKQFLDVNQFPTAKFTSTSFKILDDNKGMIRGEFELRGIKKNIAFPVEKIGEGTDPWGGYRAGFMGSTTLKLTDFGIDYNLGPASTHVEIMLYIEGVRLSK